MFPAQRNCDVVYVLNATKALIEDRDAIKEIFSPFGFVFKIYADITNHTVIKVYFANPKNAAKAVQHLHGKPPHFLNLKLKPEPVKPRSGNQSFSTFHENSSAHSNMSDDDFEATAGPRIYDIFGEEISTLVAQNNEVFVSVNELKQHNFPFYYEGSVPQKITEEDFLHQLKIYLSVKARKFLLLHKQCTPKPDDVNSTITDVFEQYTSGNQLLPRETTKVVENSSRSYSSLSNCSDNKDTTNNNCRKKDANHLRKPQLNGSLMENRKENSSPNVTNICRKSSPENSGTLTNPIKSSRIPEYSIIEILPNLPSQVVVTYVVNDRRCYVHLKMREQHVMCLLRKVQIEAKKSSAVVNPQVGHIYAAQYQGDWYRVYVLSTNPLKAHYIDYGNDNEMPIKEVRPLSKGLCSEPAEGICINFGTNPINIPLKYGVILNIIVLRQNTDKSYQVVKASERFKETPKTPVAARAKQFDSRNNNVEKCEPRDNKHNNIDNNTSSVSEVNIENKKLDETAALKKTTDCSSAPSIATTPVIKSDTAKDTTNESQQKQTETTIKIINSPRSTIMDVYTLGPGVVQYLSTMQGKHVCFVLPAMSASAELNQIENITDEMFTNKNYKAAKGDCVAVFKDDDKKWVRATVIEGQSRNGYTVALIDYGIIETADVVHKLPTEVADVPEFSCICTGSEKFAKEIKENELNFEISEKNKFAVTYSDNTTESIICSRWDPLVINKIEEKREEEPQPDPIFTLRPTNKVLSSGQVVIVSNFNDGKLLLRTLECYKSYNSLKDAISKHTATPLKQPPQLDQVVLCPYENSKELHRAIILNINRNLAEVEYIDLGIADSLGVGTLSSISEPLATMDCTLITITLNGFENGKYTEDALSEMQKYCASRTKFTAKHILKDVFDLVTSDGISLSVKLKEYDRFLYSDLPMQEPKLGETEVICINCEHIDDGIASFMPNDCVTTQNLEMIMENCKKPENSNPHIPVVEEVCLVLYDEDEEWYRARVRSADAASDQFKVTYIDYGNKGVVPSTKIRKLNDKLKNFAANAMTCKVNNFNGLNISAGTGYKVQILNSEGNDFYLVDLVQLI